jgi:phosphoribosylformylglycinamidine synthase
MDFKENGSYIAVVGVTYPELGGSEYLFRIFGLEEGEIPRPRPSSELRNGKFVYKAISLGYVNAVHDISIGGLAIALIEMAVKGRIGFEVDIAKVFARGIQRLDEILFSETQARYILEVKGEYLEDLLKLADRLGVKVSIIGRTRDRNSVVFTKNSTVLANLDLSYLSDIYDKTLEEEIEGGV